MVQECLRASEINGNFPRDVVFGPKDLGGMEWDSAHTISTVEKIKMVITQLRNGSELGQILKTAIETVQLISGLEEQMLSTKRKIEYLENCWAKTIHDNLHTIG